MNIGIVGHAADKFTPETEAKARALIREILADPIAILVSGHCPIGGIDIWAEEEYANLPDRENRQEPIIHAPKELNWSRGYKPRNEAIVRDSHILHNIVVAKYPPNYTGMRFNYCYHCRHSNHVKSGGCWTLKQAKLMGKITYRHII